MKAAFFILGALLFAGGCTTARPIDVACTMEAKSCPGGGYVGRNPARNCEFDPCPN